MRVAAETENLRSVIVDAPGNKERLAADHQYQADEEHSSEKLDPAWVGFFEEVFRLRDLRRQRLAALQKDHARTQLQDR